MHDAGRGTDAESIYAVPDATSDAPAGSPQRPAPGQQNLAVVVRGKGTGISPELPWGIEATSLEPVEHSSFTTTNYSM